MSRRSAGSFARHGLLLGSIFIVAASSLFAQERFAGIQLSTERLFPSQQVGPWVPLQLEVANLTPESRRLEIEIVSRGRRGLLTPVRWEVSLSPSAVKHEILPCFVPYSSTGWNEAEVIVSEGGRRISPSNVARVSLRTGVVPNPTTSVLVVYPEQGFEINPVRRAFDDLFGTVELVALPRERVPTNAEVYSAIRHVVLQGIEPEDLSASQREALRRAVRSGVIAWILPGNSGEGNGWVLEPGAEPIPIQRREWSGKSADVFLRENEDDETGIEPLRYRPTELRDCPFPVVLDYPDGLGHWCRVTIPGETPFFDASVEPWSQKFPLVRAGVTQWGGWARLAWVSALDGYYRQEVSLEVVFLLILSYLFIVGPGLFFVLKRKGRLIWLLWLQPLVVCLFVLLVYLVGYLNFGIPSASHQTWVVHQPDGKDWGYGASILSHYNSVARTRDVSADGGALPTMVPFGEAGRQQSWRIDPVDGNVLEDFYFPTWSLTHFSTEGPVHLGGQISVQRVQVEGEPGFEVHNGLPFSVRDPVVSLVSTAGFDGLEAASRKRLGRYCWYPGTIESGATLTFPLSECESLLSFVRADREGSWLQVRRELWGNADKPQLLVDFDGAVLSESVDFEPTGPKESNRGVLILVEEGP